jgi:hypothetical protein
MLQHNCQDAMTTIHLALACFVGAAPLVAKEKAKTSATPLQ